MIPSFENITQLTDYQIIQEAHKLTAMPSLIIYFLTSTFMFLLVGLLLVRKDKAKLMVISLIATIFNLVAVLFLIFMPSLTQSIVSFFQS